MARLLIAGGLKGGSGTRARSRALDISLIKARERATRSVFSVICAIAGPLVTRDANRRPAGRGGETERRRGTPDASVHLVCMMTMRERGGQLIFRRVEGRALLSFRTRSPRGARREPMFIHTRSSHKGNRMNTIEIRANGGAMEYINAPPERAAHKTAHTQKESRCLHI